MIRLLIISEVYPEPDKPQYGIFIKQQADELAKLGYEISVLIPFRSKEHIPIKMEGDVYKIGYKYIRYDLFPMLADKKSYEEIHELISNHFDLVAVHITSDIILKMAIYACKDKIPVIAHYHGLNVWNEYETVHPYREKMYAARRRKLLSQTSTVVGVSNKVSDIVRTRLQTVPVETVYNGVDTALFHPREKKHRGFRIVGVGNLIKIKGFQYLVGAFNAVACLGMELHIIGDGVERESLQALAGDAAVIFHGKLPYEEVSKLVGDSDLFILPSFYEALGCVYLEAMACGIPAVGVKGMGIDEIIVDGVNGFLVEPKDKKSIEQVITMAVTQQEKLKDISNNAVETVQAYTWISSANRLDSVYRQAFAQRGK